MPARFEDKSIDHLFGLYRTTGRPGYLAEVFDRTANDLLRLASHLTRDPSHAEDLLQSTFLEAIRSARRFEPGRRVLPWLSGILTNIARNERRRERRHGENATSPAAPARDPAESAEESELAAHVDEQLEALDEPYRTVLILHVRHDLSPSEIARIVQRSPATVRSQLARGRERLEGRVPRSFMGAVILPLADGRGLHAVRRDVVLRAWFAAPGLLVPQLLAQLATHKLAAATAALLPLLVSGAMLGLGTSPSAPSRESGASIAPLSGVREPAERDALADAIVTHVARTRSGAVPGERLATGRLEVAVEYGGRPLEGVGVRLRSQRATDALHGERMARTGRDGRARFDDVAPGPKRIELDRARGPSIDVRGGQDERVTIDLTGGAVVIGSVETHDGARVAGASLWTAWRGLSDMGMIAGACDAAGRFEIRGVDPDFFVAALADGFQASGSVAAVDEELKLVLTQRSATVTGRVVNGSGAPVPGALVRFGVEATPFELLDPSSNARRTITNPPVVTVRSDDEGRYEVRHAPVGRVVAFARAPEHVGVEVDVELLPGGVHRRDFVLTRGGAIEGRVTLDGAPAPSVTVQVGPPRPGVPSWFTPTTRTGTDGEYRLSGTPSGDVVVTLHVPDAGSSTRRASVGVETARLDVELASAVGIRGVVVGERGEPLGGYRVRLGESDSGSAISDERGRFRFLAPPDDPRRLSVHDVSASAWAEVAHVDGVVARETEVRIVVADDRRATAFLSGRVQVDVDGQVAGARVRARRVGAPFWGEHPVDPTTGRFRLGPLVPGAYEVIADHPSLASARRTTPALRPGESLDVGELELTRGGRVRWRVTHTGRPVRHLVHVTIRGARGDTLHESSLVESSGTSPLLPEGPIVVTAWSHDVPIVTAGATVVADDVVPVELGVEGARDVRILLESATDDALRAGLRLTWSRDGAPIAVDHHLFDSHALTIVERPLLPGSYELEVATRPGNGVRVPVRVDASDPASVRVVLPD